MKIRNHLKTVLAVICVLALFAGFVPSPAFAAEADLESIYRQVAEAQAQAAAQAKQAQEAVAQAQAQAQQQLQEMQQFDVEEAFKHLSSLKTGEEKEKYFLSLTEYQQALLLQYITKLAAAGEFHGFDDFDLPIDLLHQDEETAEAETAEPVETPEAEAADEEAAESPAETSAPAPVEAPVAVEEKEEKSFLHGFFDFLFGKSSSDDAEVPAASEEPASEEPASEADAEADTAVTEPSEEAPAPVEEAPAAESPAEEASVAEAPVTDEAALSPEAETLPEEPVADETLPEEPVAEEVLPAEEPASEPEEVRPTEEEMFYADYEHYINLYREFGSYADLSGVSYDVQQRIKALVDGPAEEDPVETPDVADEAIEASEPEAAAEPEVSELEEAAEPEAISESEAAVEPAEASASAEAEYASASSEVLASSSAVPASPKAVFIISSLTETVALGDPVVLTGVLEDADHYADIRYIWEVDKGSGVFEPVDGAEGPVYSFPATVESLRWNWRLTVLYR